MESLDRDGLIDLYRQMVLLRRFEEAAARTYREGKIPGFIHLYIGEEAIATGVCAHLQQGDYIGSTHRGHAHALAKGVPPRDVMAELWGRTTGCSGGRGGSMHLYSKEHGLLGTNGIVGYGLHLGAGAAFTAKYRGTSHVGVAFFGDGGANLGSFHEILNLAAIWKLPLVIICENNLYATELSFLQATAGQSVAARAAGYAIPGAEVDGQDVLAVYEAAEEAVARDPGTAYRTQEEIDEWKQRDPIRLFAAYLLGHKLATQAKLDEVDDEAKAIIQDAIAFADKSPWPSPEVAGTKLFATPVSEG
jgi:TPP-dependent pyruvate/acetoin dehydrogenase alpha subunit